MLGKIFLLSEVWTGQLEQVYREEYSFHERKIVCEIWLAVCHGHGYFAEKEAQKHKMTYRKWHYQLLKVISHYSHKAKVHQGGNCQNRHRQPVRHQKGVSFKPNWRNVASKVFSFARYLPAMDWKSLLVVPLPEGCSAYSRYTRPLAEHLYGELFMSVRQWCGQRL